MFGFPETSRICFKKNFLRTAIFQVVFSDDVDIEKHKQSIIPLFRESLPRINDKFSQEIQILINKDQTPTLNQIDNKKSGKGIELKSLDGQVVLSIDNTTFSYIVGGPSYSNFENLKASLQPLNNIFEICNVISIKRLAIRKINIINFMARENPNSVLNDLISEDLLSNMDYFPNREFITQNIHSISYKNENDFLNIKYGLNIPFQNSTQGLGQVIIDIDLFKLASLKCEETFIEAEKINNEIFNVFSWAISEKTKNLLNG